MKKDEDLTKQLIHTFFRGATQDDSYGGDVMEASEHLNGPTFAIPLRKARRVLELYMQRRSIANIASQIHLTSDEVREVLHIVNESCMKCGARRVGDVTLVTGTLTLCRRCRKTLDV